MENMLCRAAHNTGRIVFLSVKVSLLKIASIPQKNRKLAFDVVRRVLNVLKRITFLVQSIASSNSFVEFPCWIETGSNNIIR